MNTPDKRMEENGGIVYIDVSDYSRKLRSHGEYHKDKTKCFGAYRKARIVFVDDIIKSLTPTIKSDVGLEN